MSSFVAHGLVGAFVGRRVLPTTAGVAAGAAFALLPDVDYALLWLRDEDFAVRWTHSIAFVAVAAACVGIVWRGGFLVCLLAGLSHLAMDTLVGVHRNPLFWPLTDHGFASPVGLLPSAGRPDPANPYFWRNMLIEMGILLPLLAIPRLGMGGQIAAVGTIAIFLGWSVSLMR